MRRKINWLFHTVYQHHDVVRLLPRVQIVQQFVEDHPQAPHVALNCVGVPNDDLGRHVDGGPHRGLGRRVVFVLLVDHHLGETEI